ncbi:hypothetical protein BFL35_07780 [Clavibacter michiganensis]|nr:hypothetical protein BFL35_07780 [Clavibacter michiganensis]
MPRRVRPPVVGSVLDQPAEGDFGVSAAIQKIIDESERHLWVRRRALREQESRTPEEALELAGLDDRHKARKKALRAARRREEAWAAMTPEQRIQATEAARPELERLIAAAEKNAAKARIAPDPYSPATTEERTTSEAHGVADLVQADADRKARLRKKKRSRSTIRYDY